MASLLSEYPLSRRTAALEAVFSSGLAATAAALMASSGERLPFALSYLLSFMALFLALVVHRIRKTDRMLRAVMAGGSYEELRRGGVLELARGVALVYLSFILLLVLPPVIALGALMGALTSKGFADLTHYVYVRRLERSLGVRLVVYIENAGREGWYRWRLTAMTPQPTLHT